ncbi:FtsX-like permease family protein [Streptomyces natalensis]|uniref:Membrane protein n=1 Tax=Streptomyces natalensis ATCC 27448 TaxID=1240678 RepID=A0A0D7CFZ8_9ACTN|nr:FtsX-like permease family protein [Streptomyces natalensis]KIZ14327.1 membrane protein [Streptomyces natalensis ATCC 27448]
MSAYGTGRRASWVRDLAMGVRFAAGGGREGWIRTALTALGVGLGVVLLLGAASVPHIMENRQQRSDARLPAGSSAQPAPSARTLVVTATDTTYRGDHISGLTLRPDGPAPARPPGVAEVPGPGEMVVSPALKDLLGSPEGALLRERLPFKTVGTIGAPGLRGPGELVYYAGRTAFPAGHTGDRITGFGQNTGTDPMPPLLVLLIIVACVVLLMPVAIFIATAVRFGGERRDRRLAALRLVGADSAMARRMAAGEALFGALCGLALGGALFLALRQLAGLVTVWDINAFPADVTPVPALAALVLTAVPVLAVAVTFVALRGVAIEPLGVVRNAEGRRRRLWWRLPLPFAGAALLLLSGGPQADGTLPHTNWITGGAVLFLIGITVLLPWLVEAAVARLRGGPVPWQLATRRLQLSSGAAVRAVSGITVAVAGAIALQLFFAAVQGEFVWSTGQDSGRAQLDVSLPAKDVATLRRMTGEFRATQGVRGVIATINGTAYGPGSQRDEGHIPTTPVTVGDCAALRELAHTGPCRAGDVFVAKEGSGMVVGADAGSSARPGARVVFHIDAATGEPAGRTRPWTVPESAREVRSRPDPMGRPDFGIFATPGALDPAALADPSARALIRVDPRVPDAAEHVRNTAARLDPMADVHALQDFSRDSQFASVRTGLLVGSTVTLALIAASMLVSTLEQLRERRRLLSVLMAFGTRRATLAWSVLWQTAVPVALGLALSVVGGIGLGIVLLRLVGRPVLTWSVIWPPVAAGAALVVLVTALSLPPLWRMMRPDGLRTE